MSVEPEPGPKTGSIVMAVGSIAGAVTPRLELRLASVAGAPDMVYPWPLTVGKGEILLNCKTFLQWVQKRRTQSSHAKP